jgi:exonuclease III
MIAFFVSISFCGCATSSDDVFLVKNLDDERKAAVLADRGAELYNQYVGNEDVYEKLEEVRQYFVIALKFDPENAKAAQYLTKIDNYKAESVRTNLKIARTLESKQKRTADEDFKMLAAIQAASAADPSNEEASGLSKQYVKLRSNVADSYIAQYESALRRSKSASGVEREDALVEAFIYAKKAVAIDPSDQNRERKSVAVNELKKIIDERSSSAAKYEAKYQFAEAEREVLRITAIDRKTEGAFTEELSTATHSLNYSWAKYLESKGRYQEAATKIDKAIAARRSTEAVALKKRITDKAAALKRQSENQKAAASSAAAGANFDVVLSEIDKLIAAGDVLAAAESIDSAARTIKEQEKLDRLDERRTKIRTLIAKYYTDGVAAYRAENFKTAVSLLQIVVKVDAEYEQASVFLSKAQEKLRLVEQYTN